jgi:hypothetical protein
MGSPYVRNPIDGLIISLLLGLLQMVGSKYVRALCLVPTPSPPPLWRLIS